MFRYRTPTADDRDAMIAVHHAAVQAVSHEHYPQRILEAWSPLPDESRSAWLGGVIAAASTISCLAESVDRTVLGFGFADAESGMLKALYVHPDAAGRGVGAGLLRHLENHCRSLGISALTLNASYNAEAFYRRHGYAAMGPAEQELAGGLTMGAVRMRKMLVANA